MFDCPVCVVARCARAAVPRASQSAGERARHGRPPQPIASRNHCKASQQFPHRRPPASRRHPVHPSDSTRRAAQRTQCHGSTRPISRRCSRRPPPRARTTTLLLLGRRQQRLAAPPRPPPRAPPLRRRTRPAGFLEPERTQDRRSRLAGGRPRPPRRARARSVPPDLTVEIVEIVTDHSRIRTQGQTSRTRACCRP